ncbi:MAG: polyhydroxyalkanoate depolymerase [Caulobacter sp.]|nr:polyhydroxyalkanoate depolymerase [Caulobacter sp.]
MKASILIWTGRVLMALFALFMLGASIAPKFFARAALVDPTMIQLGWPTHYALMIGGMELGFLILYLIPRTSVLGALLMTALLGGAVATQVRVGAPLFSHMLFGVYLGLFMWGGLWLRDPALRALFPWRAARGAAAP